MAVGTLRAIVGGLLIAGSMLSIALFGIVVQAPLLFLHPSTFRIMTSRLVGTWQVWAGWIFEVWYGIKPHLTGEKIDPKSGSIIISNHRTRLDWAMIWSALARTSGGTYALKIILKADIKKLPVIGWACTMARYIFLKRKWDADAEHLLGMLDLIGSDPSYSLLIFPEGTDLNSWGLERSDKWADDRGVPHYRQVLHPRTRGTIEMIGALKKAKFPIQKVYDATMAYRGPIAQNEALLAKGKTPTAMYVHVTAFDVHKDLPQDEAGLDAWVRARFRLKEEALAAFYADEKLTLEECMTKAAARLAVENPDNGSSGTTPVATPVPTSANGAGATPSIQSPSESGAANGKPASKASPTPSTASAVSPRILYRSSTDTSPDWAKFPAASYFAAAARVGIFVLFGLSLLIARPLLTVGWFVLVTMFFFLTNKLMGGLDSFEVKDFARRAAEKRGPSAGGNSTPSANGIDGKKTR